MSNFKIIKLDSRHTGHKLFTHYINYVVLVRGGTGGPIAATELNFLKARVWFWEKFGPSAELGMMYSMNKDLSGNNPSQWAWQTEHNLLRIYVTEEALAFLC